MSLDHILNWLIKLVAIDTTSHRSNLALIQLVEDWFKQHQLQTRITKDPEGSKANIFATLPAADGAIAGGLVLSGHTDVVPVNGQQWLTDPFKAEQKDGLLYGRGTSDMKGFLAVVLALIPEFKQLQLKKPIHIAFSYDEETGCKGAPLLIADLEQAGLKPDFCIVGEPTLMQPVVAHKGIQVFRCQVKGLASHSSLTPFACNAIEYAAKLICYIRALANEFKTQGPYEKGYDVAYTTITTNMINGGTAYNIIPAHCEFFFEFRHLQSTQPKTILDKINHYIKTVLLPEMQAEHADAIIEIDNIGKAPSFASTLKENDFYQLVQNVLANKSESKVAYATEAGLFQNADIPTIVCGPGSIEQAHRANEFIAFEQLEQCRDFLLKLTGELS